MNQEALSNRRVLPGSASGQMLVNVFFNDLDVNTVNSQLINLRVTDRNIGRVTDNDENDTPSDLCCLMS